MTAGCRGRGRGSVGVVERGQRTARARPRPCPRGSPGPRRDGSRLIPERRQRWPRAVCPRTPRRTPKRETALSPSRPPLRSSTASPSSPSWPEVSGTPLPPPIPAFEPLVRPGSRHLANTCPVRDQARTQRPGGLPELDTARQHLDAVSTGASVIARQREDSRPTAIFCSRQ
jgi:hypothetical protein